MSESKFNVGDRVRNKRCGWVGVIEREFGKYPEVRYDEDPLEVYTTNESNLEFEDPKTAFLRDLSELLRKYDASVRAEFIGFEGIQPTMGFTIGNELFYLPEKGYITADNVLSHDE